MGVKSLWKLVGPVGRPVALETLEGQILAIDSSIWIYQFQATMRDKDGRALSNAHVLGFLRRIAKLLFYGIRPVFVFDGGAPALKRNTLNERKQKKSGAATSHAKLAEKLLAAQMRREAVNQAKGKQKSPTKGSRVPSGPVVLDENTVYLEDIDGSVPKSPVKASSSNKPSTVSPSKPRTHDHDPYRLPEVDFQAQVANATRGAVPDPRLATEDELRAFIEDMRPEDFDITSPAFRELPTEVQYEIVGDLRLKSRQTSFARLQNMLQKSRTPLDFSKQQILNLRQRNTLTQQLLTTTDSIGKAHLTIPVRVASERNREYLLIKNEGKDGGWILGIRDDGTKEKPIEIDQDSEKAVSDVDSDEDMEEVAIPTIGIPDQDLQAYQRSMALDAIANRQQPRPKTQPRPLFDFDDELVVDAIPMLEDDDEDDEQLAFAIQESLDQNKLPHHAAPQPRRPTMVNAVASSSKSTLDHETPRRSSDPSNVVRFALDDEFIHGNRLETALSIANAGPVRTPVTAGKTSIASMPSSNTPPKPRRMVDDVPQQPILSFGNPVLLQSDSLAAFPPASPSKPLTLQSADTPVVAASRSSPDPTPPSFGEPILSAQPSELESENPNILPADTSVAAASPALASFGQPTLLQAVSHEHLRSPLRNHHDASSSPASMVVDDEDEDMVEISTSHVIVEGEEVHLSMRSSPAPDPEFAAPAPESSVPASPQSMEVTLPDPDEPFSDWSRSPSPIHVAGVDHPPPRARSPAHENWDAAHEMDPVAEETEFAQFMSQVKGKNLDDVQREIDAEIQVLNAQKKAALRDSEDINQQMVAQIMMLLSLFGIPYITAPMEAEAQCAMLVQLGLVNGVITDDSDVFLFGGMRVYKNMFNQSKTVECFLMTDLGRELGLERDALIRLAYLLGSDYVEGLQGVGPVVAMELLGEFPGEDGLHKFKDWWTKVQSGKDIPEDNTSKFRKRFKKNFKNLYLAPEWPNPLVRDAYYHPAVDDSDEPFKWGLPDLDALRQFLYSELSWGAEKVDELLLPVIQKIRKRSQDGALNKQGNLNGYFDAAGSGSAVPRKRQAYASKRLQQVVSDLRKKRKRGSQSPAVDDEDEQHGSGSDSNADDPPPKKPAAKRRSGKTAAKSRADSSSTRGRGRGRGATKRRKKDVRDDDTDEDGSDFEGAVDDTPTAEPPTLRARPKPKPRLKSLVETGAH